MMWQFGPIFFNKKPFVPFSPSLFFLPGCQNSPNTEILGFFAH
jgi:hypothetical protein